MMARVLALAAVLLLALPLLLGCERSQAGVTLAGSTSVQPFAEALAEEYMRGHPAAVINVQGGGSSAGIEAALTGAAQVGMSSRELKPDEKAQLEERVIALDAIAIVVHPSNPLNDLSLEQARQVFAGQITSWQAFGGPEKSIHVVTREEGSGTRGAFQELVMGKVDISPASIVQDSNGAVRQVVSDDHFAVGYISLGLVNDEVKAISVGGIKASHENVGNHTYGLTRPFLYVLKGTPGPEAADFIAFTLSPTGQNLLAKEGLVPAQ